MTAVAAVQYSRGIEDAWSEVASFVPKFLGFLVILVVGYLVVKAIAKIADKALERVGFDKAVERGGVKKALESSKYDASDIVSKLVFYALFLLVLQMAFGIFGANPVSDLIASVIAFIPKAIVAVIIVVVACSIAAGAKLLIENTLGGLDYGKSLANVAAAFIVAFGFFAALNQLEIAKDIVNGLYYAVLALIVGSGIIAIGGGGIQTMARQWERAAGRIENEAPRMRDEMQRRKQELVDLAEAEQANRPTAQERVAARGGSGSTNNNR
jgi:hypothetical protein